MPFCDWVTRCNSRGLFLLRPPTQTPRARINKKLLQGSQGTGHFVQKQTSGFAEAKNLFLGILRLTAISNLRHPLQLVTLKSPYLGGLPK